MPPPLGPGRPQNSLGFIGLTMRILYTRNPLVTQYALTKLNGLLVTAVASQNDVHSLLVMLVKAEKRTFWASKLSHKMCSRKQSTKPKLLILV